MDFLRELHTAASDYLLFAVADEGKAEKVPQALYENAPANELYQSGLDCKRVPDGDDTAYNAEARDQEMGPRNAIIINTTDTYER